MGIGRSGGRGMGGESTGRDIKNWKAFGDNVKTGQ